MDIIVCIKQVPETNKVEVDPVTGVLKRDGAASKMNPYDLYAIETALRLKEVHGGKITVISMGPNQALSVIKEAFSMGADEGMLLSDRKFGGADVLATSYTLSQGIRRAGHFDLIICGKQTTDGDTAQVGPEISEYLNIPSLANVNRIVESDGESMVVEMDMGQDVEVARLPFPCLISVEKDIYQPRLPSYVKKKAMADKVIPIYSLKDMEDREESHYGLTGSPTQVQRIFPPESHVHQEIWQGAGDELAAKLSNKLQELKLLP